MIVVHHNMKFETNISMNINKCSKAYNYLYFLITQSKIFIKL